MAEYSIFEAEAADIDRVEPLWLSMLGHHRDNPPSELVVEVPFREQGSSWEHRSERYRQWLATDAGARLFLAQDANGRAVGYAFVRVTGAQASMETGRIGMLESLAVLPDQRGSGLGTALVDTVLDHFRRLGLRQWSLEVFVGNDRVRRYYESLGLRPYMVVMLGQVPGSASEGVPRFEPIE
ncbi:GNAT family N-acetyltransferase [Nocardia sp. NPDC048505]|uniref:GNAT family N-acetyltransferase n=1 Tax=unclassified Nocardia TaxID=2637762 RepID=UPI0033DCBBF3